MYPTCNVTEEFNEGPSVGRRGHWCLDVEKPSIKVVLFCQKNQFFGVERTKNNVSSCRVGPSYKLSVFYNSLFALCYERALSFRLKNLFRQNIWSYQDFNTVQMSRIRPTRWWERDSRVRKVNEGVAEVPVLKRINGAERISLYESVFLVSSGHVVAYDNLFF